MALLFGAIISPTDPAAVTAVMSELEASETLRTILEAEGLMNDGFAIVLFSTVKTVALEAASGRSPHISAQDMVLQVLYFLSVGPLMGLFLGICTVQLLRHIYNDPTLETAITLSATYLSYCVAEHIIGSNGILTVVCFSIWINARGESIRPVCVWRSL